MLLESPKSTMLSALLIYLHKGEPCNTFALRYAGGVYTKNRKLRPEVSPLGMDRKNHCPRDGESVLRFYELSESLCYNVMVCVLDS